MIFNSLFNLIENDTDGVYKFICRIFFEKNSDLGIDDKLYLFAMVKKIKEKKDINENHFIKLFENKKELYRGITQLVGDGKYNFFTNNKEVHSSELTEECKNFSLIYVEIFGIENIQNPENYLDEKISVAGC